MTISFRIEGAAAFCDMEKEVQDSGEVRYKIPEVNEDYKFGIITDELSQDDAGPFLFCSKDGEEAGIAFNVRVKGKDYNIENFKGMTVSELLQLIRN